MSENFREKFFQLEDAPHLVATLTTPLESAKGGLGVLLFNSGVIHRIGPHRINVRLSREVAQRGMPALRLDLSGLGDSRRSGGTASMLEQVCTDMRAAIDELVRRTGVERVVIVGICSGAEYGYQYAANDPRVTGLVMVDGYSFANRRTRVLRYGLRLRTLTWPVFANAVRNRLKRRSQGDEAAEADMPATDYGLPDLTARDFGRGIADRLRRGVRILMIFTGSVLQRYNHASQFRDVMAKADLPPEDQAMLTSAAVRCDYMPEIDHTLSTRDGQQRFIRTLLHWLQPLAAETNGYHNR